MQLQEMPSYMIDKDIKALGGDQDTLIKMCSNESPLGTNKNVIRKLQPFLNKLHLYPEPDPKELAQLIAQDLGINTKEIIFGNGSTELLELIGQEFIDRNALSLVSQHTYPLYEMIIKRRGGKTIKIEMKDGAYHLGAFLEKITHDTTTIFIANPNNPTGTWIPYRELEDFIKEIPKHVLIVIDEAYYDYLEGLSQYSSAVRLIHQYPNLIVTRTFSKVYGLAGIRIGYAISNPFNIYKLKLRKQSANVNTLAQYAAITAYQDSSYKQQVLTAVKKGREYLEYNFEKMSVNFIPSTTNFILIHTGKSSIDIYKKFLTKRIVVQPMTYYQLNNSIRVSVSTEENNKKFISVLSKIIKDGL